MTTPLNIFALSRIREEEPFNIVKRHESGSREPSKMKYHEIESLRLLVDALMQAGAPVGACDGFVYSFQIPQIGKEFDLLKISQRECLNIELKSTPVPEQQILVQLQKNRYYLGHLGKRLFLYTVVTGTMDCYKLSLNGDELLRVEFAEVYNVVMRFAGAYAADIDNLFRASDYLVSPLNTPIRFIQGEYFLTQAQEQIKRNILSMMDASFGSAFFHLTGKPGTGKTLLLYDIAKTLSKNGTTLVIHCGKLTKGQEKIRTEVEQLDILPVSELGEDPAPIARAGYVLVDEAHRIDPARFDLIESTVRENGLICVFSSDPEQILSVTERRNDIAGRIRALPPDGEYILSEKIRTNRELGSFIQCLKNLSHREKTRMDYADVEINYANTTQEAQLLLQYYRDLEYTFINYTKPTSGWTPFAEYEEDFDTHHVIGQEFDKVVMLMDDSFYYDDDGHLQGIPYPDPDYLYPNLFYQGVTRVRDRLALIVVKAPELFAKIAGLVKPD